MAETWRHAGAVVLGTTVERGAFDTSVLRPDNRWFDEDLAAFLLWDGAAWVHRFADNVVLYDDVGDSPMAQFVGAANEDTISIFLADDAVAGHSDLVIRLADAAGESRLEIQDSATAMRAWLNSDGDAYLYGTLGIGTETVPHGGIGYAKLALDGTATNANGPHIQTTVTTDDYPTFQLLSWAHDNIALNLDAYWQGVYRSSDAGSNFQLYKLSDELLFRYDSGIAAGNNVTWEYGITLTANGRVGLGLSGPSYHLDVYGTDENSSTLRLHRRENVDGGPTIRLRADRGVAVAGVAGDDLGYIKFEGHDNVGALTTYAQIDADIVDPTNTLEDGRLILRTTQAGALQSAIEFSTYGLINALTDIRSTGSNFPDLGTTTLAEMIGDIYQGTDKDIYPRVNELGLMHRVDGTRTWDEHFDVAALPAAWAWAGAPFAAPGAVSLAKPSRVSCSATGLNRCFLFRACDVARSYWYAHVASNARAAGNYWGVRLDDGTDNNYVEIRVSVSVYPPTQWRFDFVERTGGGVVNVTNCNTINAPYPYFIGIQVTGAKWANWAAWGHAMGLIGAFPAGDFWAGSVLGLAWTPARAGWIIYNVDGSAWYAYDIDAFTEE